MILQFGMKKINNRSNLTMKIKLLRSLSCPLTVSTIKTTGGRIVDNAKER